MNYSCDACASLRQTICHSLEAPEQVIPLSQCHVNTLKLFMNVKCPHEVKKGLNQSVMREHCILYTYWYFSGTDAP